MSKTQQRREIETIRPRTIQLNLSDADCERLLRKATGSGMTIEELLENFIGDLVGGTYSNGSAEGSCASEWFNSCWFGMFPEQTFIVWLSQNDDLDAALASVSNITSLKLDLEDMENAGIIRQINGELQQENEYLRSTYERYAESVEGDPEPYDNAIDSLKEYIETEENLIYGGEL